MDMFSDDKVLSAAKTYIEVFYDAGKSPEETVDVVVAMVEAGMIKTIIALREGLEALRKERS